MSEVDLIREIEQIKRQMEGLKRVEYAPIACRVYNDAAFTHNSTGNNVSITFNTDRWDPTGMHSVSTNTSRITFALGGWYMVGGHIEFVENNTGRRGLAVLLGGTTYIASQLRPTNATGVVTISIATLYYFAATNYVELRAFQDSGGNLDINATAAYSPEFWAIRLP